MARYRLELVKDDTYKIVDQERQYFHPVLTARIATTAQVVLLNDLDARGFTPRVRGGVVMFARLITRHDGGEAGFIEVVHYIDPTAPNVNYIEVAVPSRRAIMFRLESLARFDQGQEQEALAYAEDLRQRGIFAAGQPYTPGQLAQIETWDRDGVPDA